MHGKIIKIYIKKRNGIFKNLPSVIDGTRYHSLIIDKNTLSKSFEITSFTKDNIIMGIQHKSLPLFGIQFHPESYKTQFGQKIVNNFIDL